ncbi:MAG: PKD domain-containing protein [Capsulimonadaceae bacterium]
MTAPTCLTVAAPSGANDLTWNATANATTYNVYRSTSSGGEGTVPIAVVTSTTSHAGIWTYTDSGVSNGTLYYYVVAGVDTTGTSPVSTEMSGEPGSPTIPLPAGVAAAPGNGQAILSWVPVSGATGYAIYDESLGADTGLCFAVVGAVSSCTVTGLSNGSCYLFLVRAISIDGLGADTEYANAVATTPGSTPVAAPGSFNAAASGTTVTLSWTAPSNQEGDYYVYRGTVSGGEAMIAATTSTSYSDTGLPTNTRYYYKVAGGNTVSLEPPGQGIGEGLYTSELSEIIGSIPSSVTFSPTTVDGGATSTGTVTMTSAAPAGGLTVALSTGSAYVSVPSTVTVASGSTTASFTAVTTPPPGVTSATVTATLNDSASGTFTVDPGVSAVSMAPSAVTGGFSSTGTVTLSGAAPSGGETVQLSATAGVGVPSSVTVAGGATSATFTATTSPVQANTASTITATAGSSQSTTLTVAAPVPSALSVSPSVVNAGSSSTGTVTLTGNAAAGGVTVSISSDNSAATVPATVGVSAGTSSATFPISTSIVPAITTAHITVSLNGGQQVATLTVDDVTPASPTGLTASGGAAQATLSWSSVLGAATYNVYRSTSSHGEGSTPILSTSTTTATDTGLSAGITYYYTVAAVNSAGTSAQSAEASALTLPAAPGSPAATGAVRQISLSWAGVTSATSYNVYRGTAAGAEGASPLGTTASTSYIDSGLQDSAQFYYKITAVNATGEGPKSAETSATTYPTTPTGLAAQFSAPSTINLSWNAVTGAASYVLFRGTISGGEGSTPYQTGISGASDADTSLLPGLTYYYTVASVNAGGTSAPSQEASAVVEPAAPTSLTATEGDMSASLTWSASTGATSYGVYRGTAAGGEASTPIGTTVSTSYSDSGLTNGVTYYYVVSGMNAGGTSAHSSEAHCRPLPPMPQAPTSVTGTPSISQVTLTWGAVSRATSYNVYRATTSGAEGSTAYSTGITGLSFTDTGLTAASQYYYTVTAVNLAGESAPSTEVPVLTLPAAPTGLTAVAGVGQVSLAWTASVGTVTYSVYRGTASGAESGSAVASGLTGVAYLDTSVTNGVTYYYTVAAVTTQATSAMSNEASAMPQVAPPSTPTGLSAAPGNGSVSLTWYAAVGASSYSIFRGSASGAEGSVPVAAGLSGPGYVDTSAANGSTYYYTVTAVNPGGSSSTSTETSTSLPSPAPGAPTGPSASAGDGQVTLSWAGSAGSTSYSVYRGTAAGAEAATPVATGITGLTYTDASVADGSNYFYTVAALAPSGSIGTSTEVSGAPAAAAAGAPAGLTATSGTGQVYLAWSPVAGATGYVIYRGAASGAEGSAPIATVLNANYGDTGATAGALNYYTVAAVMPSGTSAASGEATGISMALAPLAPAGLTAAPAPGNVMNLSWSTSSGAATYSVYRGTASGQEAASPVASGLTSTSFTDSALSGGTAYYYTVAAVNGGGPSPSSAEAGATATTGVIITSAAAGPSVVSGTSTSLTVVAVENGSPAGLSTVWTQTSGSAAQIASPTSNTTLVTFSAAGTRVFGVTVTDPAGFSASASVAVSITQTATTVSISPASATVPLGSTQAFTASVADQFGAPDSTPVTWSIASGLGSIDTTGLFHAGSAPGMSTVQATAGSASATAQVTIPDGPPSITSTTVSANPVLVPNASVSVTATDAAGTSGLTYAWTATGPAQPVFASPTASTTGVTFSQPGSYVFQVVVTNAAGLTATGSVSTAVYLIPAAPSATATPATTQVALSWGAVSGATTYNVYRATASGAEGTAPYTTGITAPSFTDTGLTPASQYYYTVTSVNLAGESAQSSEVPALTLPAAATGLTAVAGVGQVSLAWTASAGTVTYSVYRGTASGAESGSAVASGLTGVAYLDTSVTNGVLYYYTVAAVTTQATSAMSNEASAMPQVAPPSTPSALSAAPGNGSVSLTWSAAVGASSYSIFRGTASGAEGSVPVAAGLSGPGYVDTSAANGSTCYYTVTAVNPGGLSSASAEASTALPTPAPGAPTGLSASAGDGQVTLSWAASSGATSYSVFRATSSGAEGANPIATGITVPTYTDAGVTDGVSYYYTVTALAGTGAIGTSSEVSGTPAAAAFGAPAGLTATSGTGQVYLVWSPVAGATGYVVYRGASSGAEGSTPIATVSDANYGDTSASTGSVYYYTVAAITLSGTSAASGEAAGISMAPAPQAPAGLTASPAAGDVMNLSWSSTSGAATYNVYRGTASGQEAAAPVASGVTSTSFADSGVSGGTAYYYTVAAVNGGGPSPSSPEAAAMATTGVIITSAAAGPSVVTGNSTSLTVVAAENGSSAGLSVQWTQTSGSTAQITSPTSSTTLVTFSTAGACTFGVVVTDPAGMSASASVAVSVTQTATSVAISPATATVALGATRAFTSSVTDQFGAPDSTAATWSIVSGLGSIDTTGLFHAGSVPGTSTVQATAGSASATAQVTIPDGAPSISATTVSANPVLGPTASVAVSATDAAGTSGLTYAWTATGPQQPVFATPAESTSGVTFSAPGSYVLQVVVTNAAGLTATGSVSTTVILSPGAPSVPTATAGSAQVTLSWGSVSAATSYGIYRATTSGAEGTTAVAASSGTSYTDAGLSNGVTYYYKIAAVNAAGTSAQSPQACATPEPPIPGAPTSLSATAGNGQVSLTWTGSAGAASYGIYRATASGAEGNTAIATASGTSFTNLGLSNGVTYYYTVAAINGGGTSAPSNEASATPEPPVPAAPSGLSATAGNAVVSLSWTGASGAASYNIYRATSRGAEGTTATGTTSGTTYSDTGVTNGITFYYTVAAVNGGGTSAQSAEVSATPEPPIPAAPSTPTATSTATQVALTWGTVAGATTYNIYQATVSGAEGTTPYATGVTASTFIDTGVVSASTYYYTVAGVNSAGVSAQSGECQVTTLPEAPGNLTAAASVGQVTLNWTPSDGSVTYSVYRGTVPGGELDVPLMSGLAAASYVDSEVSDGQTYYYTVAAVTPDATSAMSNETSAEPINPAPCPPAELFAGPGNERVSLSWAAAAGATCYDVYRGTSSGGEGSVPIAGGLTGTGFVDTQVTNGSSYYYTVDAADAGGTSAQSAESVVVLPVPQPGAPTSLCAAAGVKYVVLGWSGATGATSYNVYRGTASGEESSKPIAADVTENGYTDTGLLNGTAYYYEVAAVISGATTGVSNEAGAIPSADPTGEPTGLTSLAGDGLVYLAWTSVPGATSYTVYRATSVTGFDAAVIGSVSAANETDTAVTDGTPYYYAAVAVGADGSVSSLSNEAAATPEPPAPLPPLSVTASPDGTGAAALSWSTSAGATTYNVYRGTASGDEALVPVAAGLTGTSFTDTGLSAGTFYFVVASVNGGGPSPASTEANTPVSTTITISSASATPAVVTGSSTALAVTASENGSSSGLTYKWTESSGPSASIASSTSTSATVTFRAAGTYAFKITVKDGHGRSASAIVGVTVLQTVTSVVVSPTTATVALNLTRTFKATVRDQFNAVDRTAVTWSIESGVGSIAQTGVYSAGTVPGTAIVEATVSGLSATASVTVRDNPPTITLMTISADPILTPSAIVSVTATDAAGTSGLTYSWTGPASVSFASGTASSTAVSFTKSGTFTLHVVVTNAAKRTASGHVTAVVKIPK